MRREAYLAALSNPSSSSEFIDKKKEAVIEHRNEWSQDREVALQLRHENYNAETDSCYECDDKCGSWWQVLPVMKGGRLNKGNVKKAYHFCIQSNTISGADGVLRFAFVPKNVGTGSNFGLTNLIMTIWRAHQKGLLTSTTKKKLIRHTDGGPDNLSTVTHIVHWLLVYLGIFDEVCSLAPTKW